MSITAVGYTLEFTKSEELNEIFQDRKLNIELTDIQSGVLYSKSCRGGLSDAFGTHEEMNKWFNKREKGSIKYTATIYELYIYCNPKGEPKVIVASIKCEGDRFYSVLWNGTKGYSTTIHKKNANSGQYGKPLVVDIKVPATPYLF